MVRDVSGPEVDYVLDRRGDYIPIEVKWSDKPKVQDAKHIKKFIAEYPEATRGYIICRTPHRYEVSPGILALPWQEMESILST
jgi:predicted AAA+ superfamily ATPase